jgi:hypothetical protein
VVAIQVTCQGTREPLRIARTDQVGQFPVLGQQYVELLGARP